MIKNNHRLHRVILLVLAAVFLLCGAARCDEYINWTELPELPAAPGTNKQIGLAGMFAGVHNGALIVAGGANFPLGSPWEGGAKTWWDDIYVLTKTDSGYKWITDKSFKLPVKNAYGISVSTPDGVLIAGGCDGGQCYRDTLLLKWNPKTKKIETETYPPLPRPLGFTVGAIVGNRVFVAGGRESAGADAVATKDFWSLDLSKKGSGEKFRWEELEPWPGEARELAVLAAQSNGVSNNLYLFSGKLFSKEIPIRSLTDVYEYNVSSGKWKRLNDIVINGGEPKCVMGAGGVAVGANHILVFGGDDGVRLSERVRLEGEIKKAKAAGDTKKEKELRDELNNRMMHNPGFTRDIFAYHTITDTWAKVGEFPTGNQVTTTAVMWDGKIVIPSGEIRPGIRTPKVWSGNIKIARGFGALNYAVLTLYLVGLVLIGLYFSKRQNATDDFFKAGGRIPWWAAGLSIFGTSLSAITFMAIPAKTFATDWRYMFFNHSQLIAVPIVVALLIPVFRRLNITTSYEYLEKRFNVVVRLLGSAMFLLFQFGRLGIVLFLPSIALSIVTGININVCILAMGLLSIAYTVMGGIEAVIWTDVVQVIVLLGGALLSLVIIMFHLDGGLGGFIDIAIRDNKLHTFDFTLSLMQPTLWGVGLGGVVSTLINAGSDQTFVQRYLTTKDEKSAKRSLWTFGLVGIPSTLIFFGLGTALYAFYKTHPALLDPGLNNTDAIFPWYIVSRLPAGVAGFLIAGLFAAAMSSLDSSMNSAATVVTTDFLRRFKPEVSDQFCLKFARWITVIVGLSGTAFALFMAQWEIVSLWDEFQRLLGLLAGGLGGLFMLGVVSRRANGVGAVIGLIGSGIVQYFISIYQPVHLLLFTFTGFVSCMIIGFVASIIIPVGSKPIQGLTIYTIDRTNKGDYVVKK